MKIKAVFKKGIGSTSRKPACNTESDVQTTDGFVFVVAAHAHNTVLIDQS